MKLFVLALTALISLAPLGGKASAQEVLRIVAVVNDEIISERDLRERLRLVTVTSGIPPSPENLRRLAPQVLRGLIDEKLQMQEARRFNISVQDEEIERAFASIAQQNNMEPAQLRSILEANGVGSQTLRRQLEAQIAWLRVIGRQVRPRVTVTEAQIDLAVQQQLRSSGQPEYLLSEIVLPVDDPSQEAIVAGDAARLIEALQGGASFEALARQFSAAATAERGDDVGWVPATTVPPELRPTLDTLAPGEVTEPLRSNVGYHVFLLRDRRTPIGRAGAEVEVTLAQIFFPAANGGGEDVDGLRAQAAALRPQLNSCAAMDATAEEIGAPSSGTLGTLRIGDLPPDIGRVVLELPVGQVSQPLRGPEGIHLLMVCDRQDGAMPAADRQRIAERLEEEQIERLARRYLRDLRADAYIDLRLGNIGAGAFADRGP